MVKYKLKQQLIRKQRNGYECGAIAIYNALILTGKYKSLKSIYKLLKLTKEGTSEKQMLRALTKINLLSNKKTTVLILGYYTSGGYGHYVTLFTNPVNKRIVATNCNSDLILDKYTFKRLKRFYYPSDKWLVRHLNSPTSDVYTITS